MESTDYNIPPAILNGLEAHRDRLHPVGDFLTAVLENNLTQAVGLADDFSMSALKDIVMWCYWELPAPAWGSEEKVAAWLTPPPATGLKHVSSLVDATMATIESYLDAAHDCGEQEGRREANQDFHQGTDHESF